VVGDCETANAIVYDLENPTKNLTDDSEVSMKAVNDMMYQTCDIDDGHLSELDIHYVK